LLERYAIRHLPVVEEERVVGVLSKNDLRETLGAPDPDYGIRDHLDWPVSRVMTDEVVTVRRETSVTDAIDLLISKQIGAVPVVDDQQQLVGVLSVVDVLRAARRYFA
jgi:acetoin utilization protein AcuB